MSHMCKRRFFSALAAPIVTGAAIFLSLGPSGAIAQIAQPVRILVPFPAGGTLDALARAIADKLKDKVNAPVVVENRPGASGVIALEALVASPGDGKTILLAPFAVPVLNPLTMARPVPAFGKDYLPVALCARYSFAIAVAPSHPAKTMAGLEEWLKANPKQALFGTAALGNMPHFIGLSLASARQFKLDPVGYKGAPPLKIDMIGGHVPVGISSDADFVNEHLQGKLRVLATTGSTRSALLPDVPTFKEAGIDLVSEGWFGAFVPGTSTEPVIRSLQRDLVEVLQSPAVRATATRLGLQPATSTPEQLGALVTADVAKWSPVVKASNFKIE